MKYLKGLKNTGLLKTLCLGSNRYFPQHRECMCVSVSAHMRKLQADLGQVVLLLPHSLRQGLSNGSAGWQVSSETCCCPCPCTRVTATCNNKCFPLEPSPLAPQPRGSSDPSAYLVVICRLLINRLSYHHGRTRYGP